MKSFVLPAIVTSLVFAGCLEGPPGEVVWTYAEGSPEIHWDSLNESLAVMAEGRISASNTTNPFIRAGIFRAPCNGLSYPADSTSLDSFEREFDARDTGNFSEHIRFTLDAKVPRGSAFAVVVSAGEGGSRVLQNTCHGGTASVLPAL